MKLSANIDSAALRDKLRQQEIDVTNAESAETDFQQQLRIQEQDNESRLAKADLDLTLAKLDLEKYTKGEYEQQFNKLSGAVAIKEEELLRKDDAYDFTRAMARKGFRNQSEVDAARIAVKQARLDLAASKDELRVLEEYTKKRTEAELKAQAIELERELERVKIANIAAMARATTAYDNKKQTAIAEREKRDKLEEQIKACTLRAPIAGEVVYANLDSRVSQVQVVMVLA